MPVVCVVGWLGSRGLHRYVYYPIKFQADPDAMIILTILPPNKATRALNSVHTTHISMVNMGYVYVYT